MELETIIKLITAGIAEAAVFIWGQADKWLYALIVMVILDYISGVIAAAVRRQLSCTTGFTGILKKVLFLIVAGIAHVADNLLGMGGIGRTAIVAFLIANEGMSIIENCASAGVRLPPMLTRLFKQISAESKE